MKQNLPPILSSHILNEPADWPKEALVLILQGFFFFGNVRYYKREREEGERWNKSRC